jgi:murein L,D-transpeptidase YafK
MRQTLLFCFLLLNFTFLSLSVWADDEVWILIDINKLQLEVKKGNKTIAVMENVAIGRGGAGLKKRVGDDITPIGTYRIGWINNKSSFYRFYGFDYPSVANANEALLSGLLSKKAHTSIVNAHKKDKVPPQNTAIGGRIGIHGLGKGDESIHKMMNWTHGCIALSNDQIDKLKQWINKGTLVKVK